MPPASGASEGSAGDANGSLFLAEAIEKALSRLSELLRAEPGLEEQGLAYVDEVADTLGEGNRVDVVEFCLNFWSIATNFGTCM